MSAGWIIKHFYVIHWALILTAAHNREEYPSGIQMFNHEVFSTQGESWRPLSMSKDIWQRLQMQSTSAFFFSPFHERHWSILKTKTLNVIVSVFMREVYQSEGL